MTGRRFRVRVRPNDATCSSNLFARLSPQVAQSLHDEAVREEQQNVEYQDLDNGWTACSSQISSSCESGVEFLPLQVTLPSCETVYVSYNGGSIIEQQGGSSSSPCIELPCSVLAEDFDNSIHHVIVTPLCHVTNATSIYMEPLDCSDWELLETHAEFLESGGLLDQVTVVFPNQLLRLWVGGRDVVSVKVLCKSFGSDDDQESWTQSSSDEEEEDSEEEEQYYRCLRLVADTEVIVTPKPRPLPSETSLDMSEPLRVYPTLEDWSPAMKHLQEVAPSEVPPRSLAAHPDTLNGVPGWKERNGNSPVFAVVCQSRHDDVGMEAHQQGAVVCVCESELVPKGHVACHHLVRYQIGVAPLCDHVRIRILNEDQVCMGPKRLLESVQYGNASVFLESVSFKTNTSVIKPWHQPYDGTLSMQVPYSQSRGGGSSRVTKLRSILASWVDLPDAYKDLPLSPGSLISLPWTEPTSDTSLYRLAYECGDPSSRQPLFVLAKDLPSLLLQSKSDADRRSQYEQGDSNPSRSSASNSLELPQFEILLNLLPPTPNVVPSSKEEASTEPHGQSLVNGIGSLDCIVISGETGSGKTHSALVLAARTRLAKAYATVYLDCQKLQSSSGVRMHDILSELTDVFRQASQMRPCLVVLDNVDEIAPNMHSDSGDEQDSLHHQQVNPVAVDQAKLISNHLESLVREMRVMDQIEGSSSSSDVCVVFTSRDKASTSRSLLGVPICPVFVAVPDLDGVDRKAIFSHMLKSVLEAQHSPSASLLDFGYPDFAKKTQGFRPRDLEIVAKRVQHILYTSSLQSESNVGPASLTGAMSEALEDFTPLSRQSVGAEDVSSSAGWSEVGGLFDCKHKLSATMLHPTKYRAIYARAPIQLPRGILLYGPPGCGKSMLVPALAAECDFNLITCRGPELLDKYIGASEAKVRQLFARAASAAPSLLFLDELDALAPRRGSDHTGVTDRVVNQLLTFLDGVEDVSGKDVYIVAATSRPDKVDPALLRPGRLEQHVFVGYPESEEEWNDLFGKIVTSRDNVSKEVQNLVASGQLLNRVRGCTPQLRYLAAADFKAVMDTAHLEAVHEYLANNNEKDMEVEINLEHLFKALRTTRPSLPPDDRQMLSRAYAPFKKDDDGLVSAIGVFDGDVASGTPLTSGDALDEYLPGRGPLKTALR